MYNLRTGPDRTNGPIQNTVRRGPVHVLCKVLYFADLVRKLLCTVRDSASSPLRYQTAPETRLARRVSLVMY